MFSIPDHVGSEIATPVRKSVEDAVPHGKRNFLNRGLVTVLAATGLLFVACLIFAPSSLHRGTLLTMLPFAAALAVAALGQTLVVMQGGIDLSVAGGFSLYVVILTKYPAGDNGRLWTALALAFAASIVVGCVNGTLIGRMGLNPIVATLGTNAILYGVVFWYSNDIPTTTTTRLASFGGAVWLGIPAPVYLAVVTTAFVTLIVKLTPTGRRFEGVGSNKTSALTAGIRVKRHRAGAYVWAQVLYCLGAVLHSSIVNQPTAHEGDNYLLPTVAVVVLGGTSLLGGRGNLAATAIAAVFLSQLDQFVLSLGVSYATQSLVQAGALAVGIALYTIDWKELARRLSARRSAKQLAPT